jgi:lipopolysaccharide/colanic/teichoic acid biosynthesis glycosyltransferase
MSNASARLLKRAMDVIGAGILLLITLPLLIIVAVVVRVTMGAPVLFRQVRPGLRGDPLTLYKFRTMLEAKDADERTLPDVHRLTKFGRFLRSTSIDELPELVNVLRGDMSLVGPRPLLVEYLPLYSPRQARRHEVRPGITGLAQVSGRNSVGWDERLELDVAYVDSWSIAGDMRILLRTLAQVVRRDGIAAEGHATMPHFEGTGRRSDES